MRLLDNNNRHIMARVLCQDLYAYARIVELVTTDIDEVVFEAVIVGPTIAGN